MERNELFGEILSTSNIFIAQDKSNRYTANQFVKTLSKSIRVALENDL